MPGPLIVTRLLLLLFKSTVISTNFTSNGGFVRFRGRAGRNTITEKRRETRNKHFFIDFEPRPFAILVRSYFIELYLFRGLDTKVMNISIARLVFPNVWNYLNTRCFAVSRHEVLSSTTIFERTRPVGNVRLAIQSPPCLFKRRLIKSVFGSRSQTCSRTSEKTFLKGAGRRGTSDNIVLQRRVLFREYDRSLLNELSPYEHAFCTNSLHVSRNQMNARWLDICLTDRVLVYLYSFLTDTRVTTSFPRTF